MRKNLSELLASWQINYGVEYDALWCLLNRHLEESYPMLNFEYCGHETFWELIAKYFMLLPSEFGGTCVTLYEMDRRLQLPLFHECKSLDELLLLMEYVSTILMLFDETVFEYRYHYKRIREYILNHISVLAEKLEHKFLKNEKGLWLLIPKNTIQTAVVSELPKDIQIKTLEYYHRSMQGNIEGKKSVLRSLGKELEAHRVKVEELCRPIADDVFTILNNLDIRHANADTESKSYHPGVAALPKERLEKYYDDLYELMMAAFACFYCRDIHANDMPIIKSLAKKV